MSASTTNNRISELREENRRNNQRIKRIEKLLKGETEFKKKLNNLYDRNPVQYIYLYKLNKGEKRNIIAGAIDGCSNNNEKCRVFFNTMKSYGLDIKQEKRTNPNLLGTRVYRLDFDEIMDLVYMLGINIDETELKAYYDANTYKVSSITIITCDICCVDDKVKVVLCNRNNQRVCQCSINMCGECCGRMTNKRCPTCRVPWTNILSV